MKLDHRADLDTGYLQTLMDQLESRSPQRVTDIQNLLTQIEALTAIEDDISASALEEGAVTEKTVFHEHSTKYAGNVNVVVQDTRRQKANSFRQRIRRYLDPHGYLHRYSGVGRLIH